MSVQFTAPYPQNQTTTFVRNPEWNDSENLKDQIDVKHALDGTLYTYIKKQAHRRRLMFSFILTFHKALELQGFFRAYYASKIYIKDHLEKEWVGYATNNPFEFTTDGRGTPGGGGELVNFQLEFEAVPLGYEDYL